MYNRHFDKQDCDLLVTALDYYLCNSGCNEKTAKHVEALMLEFDQAYEDFGPQISITRLSEKVLQLNFD